jgi:hypothetical protein
MKLRLELPERFPVDDIYAKLVALGSEKTDRDARQAVAALALLLINHIGDVDVIDEAIEIVQRLPSTDS